MKAHPIQTLTQTDLFIAADISFARSPPPYFTREFSHIENWREAPLKISQVWEPPPSSGGLKRTLAHARHLSRRIAFWPMPNATPSPMRP